MADIHAFRAEGSTVKVSATTTSGGTPVQVHAGMSKHVRVWNSGAAEAYVAFGASAIAAVVPVAGTPAVGMPIAPGATEIFTATVGYMAALTAAGTADLFVTPGEGV